MTIARLTEIETIDILDMSPAAASGAISELTIEVRRCWAQLAELRKSADFLNALEAAGVDNWEGYSIACRERGDEDDDE